MNISTAPVVEVVGVVGLGVGVGMEVEEEAVTVVEEIIRSELWLRDFFFFF